MRYRYTITTLKIIGFIVASTAFMFGYVYGLGELVDEFKLPWWSVWAIISAHAILVTLGIALRADANDAPPVSQVRPTGRTKPKDAA